MLLITKTNRRTSGKARTTMKKSSGFTLIELMVVVAILAVVVAIAAPSFGDLQKDSRLDSAAKNLNSAIRLARSEAIAKNAFVRVEIEDESVTVCRRDDTAAACPAIGDVNTFRTLDVGFRDLEVASPDIDLATGFVFDARGRLAVGAAFDISVCDDRGAEDGQLIQINSVGRSNLRAMVGGDACA